jgi:hypothetical protein
LLIALECLQVPTNPSHNPLDQVKTSELELDKAAVVEVFREFDVSQEEPETIENLDAEMSVLECTFEGCTLGVGGAKFKTPALDSEQAVVCLRYHMASV